MYVCMHADKYVCFIKEMTISNSNKKTITTININEFIMAAKEMVMMTPSSYSLDEFVIIDIKSKYLHTHTHAHSHRSLNMNSCKLTKTC